LTASHWEIIADDLSKVGWSLGWVSAVDCQGQTIWIADAHADEKLMAFLELESAVSSVQVLLLRKSESETVFPPAASWKKPAGFKPRFATL
jgi:hypothetical protein